MHIEVYAVPTKQWTDNESEIRIKANQRVISMSGGTLSRHHAFPDRAEIAYLTGGVITTAGSYDEILERWKKALREGREVAWLEDD